MSRWNLYWVSVECSPEENCFVIARKARSAAKYEEYHSGFNLGDARAELIVNIPEALEKRAIKAHQKTITQDGVEKSCHPWPSYAPDWLLTEFGHTTKYYRRGILHTLLGKSFFEASLEESYGFDKRLIESVSDILKMVKKLEEGRWLFRGQNDAAWPLMSSIYRKDQYSKWRKFGQTLYESSLLYIAS